MVRNVAFVIDRRTRQHSTLTASQRRQRARRAAYARWARSSDRSSTAEAGQRGLRERFAKLVDPDGELPEHERERRIDAAVRSHMTGLAYRRSRNASPGAVRETE